MVVFGRVQVNGSHLIEKGNAVVLIVSDIHAIIHERDPDWLLELSLANCPDVVILLVVDQDAAAISVHDIKLVVLVIKR